jgi:CheY-like chemotaxis protein
MREKIKILLVEDEILIAVLLKRNLQMVGYETLDPVVTGEEAISVANRERPDVVLMDIRLAGKMDGLETAQEIIARYNIPIIFMSGYSDKETLEKAQTSNVIAYLVKPITPDHIVPILESYFSDGDEE